MEKIRLAVIFGGRACEHDVSVVHAVQCMDAADPAQYDVIPVYISRDGGWYTGEALRRLETLRAFSPGAAGTTKVYPDVTAGSGALLSIARKRSVLGAGGDTLTVAARMDAALLVLHGTNGEDGAVQGLLELMNVPYTSSGLVGSAVGMDKIVMRQLFRGCGFPVLDAVYFDREEWTKDPGAVTRRVARELSYPVFVKPANLGSSIGITRVDEEQSLARAVEVALSYDRRALVETAVKNPVEVNCSVLGFGGEAIPSVCEMPVSWKEFLTFDEKYLRGEGGKSRNAAKSAARPGGGMETQSRRIPAPIGDALTQRIQSLSADVFRALDCKGVVRIDFLLDGEKVFVGEINTIPGALSFYLWEPMGMPYARLIDRLVEYAFRSHAEKNKSVFAYDSALLNQAARGAKGAKG